MKLTLLILSIFFMSCATHAPMSEVAVLSSKKKLIEKKGLSSQVFMPNSDGMLSQQASKDNREYKPAIGISRFENFYFDDSLSSKGAISISIGKGTGIDATIQIFGPVYISGAVSLPENLYLSLPVRLHENQTLGFSLSPVIKQQSVPVFEDESFNVFRPFLSDGYENFRTVGIKLNFITIPYSVVKEYNRGFFSISLEGGTFLEVDDHYISISAGFGFF